MATYQELIAQRDALARQQADIAKAIAEQTNAHRQEGIAKVKALMAEYALSIEDLSSTNRPGKSKSATAGDPSRKVAAKYRNAETGDSWSGRGLKPKWLAAAIASGKTLQDFAV